MKYKPTLIIHGGAGALSRSAIPPCLYDQYHASLLAYLRSTRDLLESGSSALDAAVHAVSLLEDDELFNCSRGSVFTSAGTIEMEASVMVTSMNDPDQSDDVGFTPGCFSARPHCSSSNSTTPGSIKRGVGVIGLRNVRHPIQLARETLLRTGLDNTKDGGNMHAQLSGAYAEELACKWGLQFEPDEYFWTKRRWEEHLRMLDGGMKYPPVLQSRLDQDRFHREYHELDPAGTASSESFARPPTYELPSGSDVDLNALPQGTVGCVCLDQDGNLAVATSTGGKTNKVPGRVGDTPTLGAGFWAERWVAPSMGLSAPRPRLATPMPRLCSGGYEQKDEAPRCWTGCIPSFLRRRKPSSLSPSGSGYGTNHPIYIDKATQPSDIDLSRAKTPERESSPPNDEKHPPDLHPSTPSSSSSSSSNSTSTSLPPYQHPPPNPHTPAMITKAIALSGTGNGDSILRVCAARTVSAMARFSSSTSLSDAVTAVVGPGGELQQSAGERWGNGEGEGGMIGIEVEDSSRDLDGRVRGKVVWDFNCGGMWRAWIEDEDSEDRERVMVFRESYY